MTVALAAAALAGVVRKGTCSRAFAISAVSFEISMLTLILNTGVSGVGMSPQHTPQARRAAQAGGGTAFFAFMELRGKMQGWV